MDYLIVKWLHVLGAVFLFGTGLGSAFYKFFTDRSGNVAAMAVTNRLVVRADWIFTATTIVLQPVTGFAMMGVAGWPLSADWIRISLALYLLAGVCWLPVVVLQIRMARMTETAAERGTPLPRKYAEMALRWTLLGVPAFVAMIAITYLMVLKPS